MQIYDIIYLWFIIVSSILSIIPPVFWREITINKNDLSSKISSKVTIKELDWNNISSNLTKLSLFVPFSLLLLFPTENGEKRRIILHKFSRGSWIIYIAHRNTLITPLHFRSVTRCKPFHNGFINMDEGGEKISFPFPPPH